MLVDTTIRKKTSEKPRKLSGGKGLYLRVTVSDGKLQWWADYLDSLREAKNVIHFKNSGQLFKVSSLPCVN